MIGKNEQAKKPVSMAEAEEILEERKEDGELGYEQKLAYEHAKKFVKLKASDAKKLTNELEELGISAAAAVKVADIMPVDDMQLKQALAIESRKSSETADTELSKKIMGILEKYRGK